MYCEAFKSLHGKTFGCVPPYRHLYLHANIDHSSQTLATARKRGPQLVAMRREARSLFHESTLLDLHRARADEVLANPPDCEVIQPGDSLFGLAFDQSHFKPSRVCHPLILGAHDAATHRAPAVLCFAGVMATSATNLSKGRTCAACRLCSRGGLDTLR